MKCIYVPTMMALGLSLSLPALGQSTSPKQSARLPEDLGYPRDGTRRGGGSRGGVCDLPPEVPPLTALMPDTATWTTDETEQIVFSLTNRSEPELWFYLPYALAETSQVNFTLKDAAGETLSRTRLNTSANLPVASSIIRVAFEELGISLTPEAGSQWYLTVRCSGGPPVTVNGWVSYRPQSLPENSRQFFVDTVSTLANMQLIMPENGAVQTEWRELLESVGLNDITEAPVLDCCTFIE